MNRMLVIGAGASVEECKRSGLEPNNHELMFPLIKNFGDKLFQRDPTPDIIVEGTQVRIVPNPYSGALLRATAAYLTANMVNFNPYMLHPIVNEPISQEAIENNPVNVFCRLEQTESEKHNIEQLCEYTWNVFGTNPFFWERFIFESIYFNLFYLFTHQFGTGMARTMQAGTKISSLLNSGDVVLNLNYDILFDIALLQNDKKFCYAPQVDPTIINMLKPHGSINLYVNNSNGNFFFEQPDIFHGSAQLPDSEGGTFSPHGGILPPRLNKNYAQHPIAEYILSTIDTFSPRVLTFWGVGLTPSDTDLLEIYKEASENAEMIEFINPDSKAHENAEKLLNKKIKYFPTLHDWFEKYGIVD